MNFQSFSDKLISSLAQHLSCPHCTHDGIGAILCRAVRGVSLNSCLAEPPFQKCAQKLAGE